MFCEEFLVRDAMRGVVPLAGVAPDPWDDAPEAPAAPHVAVVVAQQDVDAADKDDFLNIAPDAAPEAVVGAREVVEAEEMAERLPDGVHQPHFPVTVPSVIVRVQVMLADEGVGAGVGVGVVAPGSQVEQATTSSVAVSQIGSSY